MKSKLVLVEVEKCRYIVVGEILSDPLRFAFEHYGIIPDILVMAKGIANGIMAYLREM